MANLLPCPFCGSTNIEVITDYLEYGGRMVGFCQDCRASGPPVPINLKDIKRTKQQAADKWGKRSKVVNRDNDAFDNLCLHVI